MTEIWTWLQTQEGWLALYGMGLVYHAVFGSLDFMRRAPGGVGGWHFVRWGGYRGSR